MRGRRVMPALLPPVSVGLRGRPPPKVLKMNHRVAALCAGPAMTVGRNDKQKGTDSGGRGPRDGALTRGDIGDHRQRRREVMLQRLVGIDAGLGAPRARRRYFGTNTPQS